MMETTVLLKPQSEWRPKQRWYSAWAPEWLKDAVLRRIWPDRIAWDELVAEMDQALRIPGTTNAWTMPIKSRIDMLTTGVRTPVGIKIFGADLAEIEAIGAAPRGGRCGAVPGTRSVFAERAAGGYFVDFDLKRDELARYGLIGRRGAGRRSCPRSAARTSPPPSRAARASRSTSATRASCATTSTASAASWS